MTERTYRPERKSAVAISKRLVIVNSISSVLARFLNMLALLWVYQHLLKRIPPDEFAIYPVIAGIMLLVPLFTSFLNTGVERHGVEAYARGDQDRVTELVSSILPILAATGVVILIAGFTFSWFIDHALTIPAGQLNEARLMMALLIVRYAFEFVLMPFNMGFHIKQRFVLLNAVHVGRDLLRIVLLLVLLFGVSTRVLWVVVAGVVAEMTAVAIIIMLSRRMVPALRFRLSRFSWPTARWVVSFGIWVTLGRAGQSLQNGLGPLVLNKLATSVNVNAFYIANLFEKQIIMITNIALGPLQPSLTAMHATGDVVRLGNAYLRGGRYALWATLAVAVPLAIFSGEIIRLYAGETYDMAALVLVLLLATYPITAGNALLLHVASATARVKSFSLWSIASQIVSLLLMIYFVGPMQMGAVGVGLAILVTMSFTQVFVLIPLGLNIARVPLGRLIRETYGPGLLPALAGGLVWAGLLLYHPPSGWIEVGAFSAIGFAVYVFVLFTFALHGDDKRDLSKVKRKAAEFWRQRVRRQGKTALQ